jgi:hypothetical protein
MKWETNILILTVLSYLRKYRITGHWDFLMFCSSIFTDGEHIKKINKTEN